MNKCCWFNEVFLWRGWDLNPRPRAYESPALPLSYPAPFVKRGNITMPGVFCQQTMLYFIRKSNAAELNHQDADERGRTLISALIFRCLSLHAHLPVLKIQQSSKA